MKQKRQGMYQCPPDDKNRSLGLKTMNVEEIISRCIEASVSLTLKGEQISVAGDIGSLDKSVIARIKENKQAIIDWLKTQQAVAEFDVAMHREARNSDTHPVTPGQQLIWLLDNIEGQSAQYNKSSAVKIDRILNQDIVQQAVIALAERHESLRTRFSLVDDQLRQMIDSESRIEVKLHKVDTEDESALLHFADELAKQPFDLENDALLRVNLIHIADTWSVVVFTVHHIIADGWSEGVLFKEFCAFFAAFESGQSVHLPELPLQFVDYAYWLEKQAASGAWQASLDYWSEQLKDIPASHNLPMDNPRPVHQTYVGKGVEKSLGQETLRKLEALAADNNATLYMVLQTAYALLLCRWSNEAEIVVGTAVSGREVDTRLVGQIGYYSNVVALRTRMDESLNFVSLLEQNRRTITNAFKHQTVPFAHVVERLKVPVDPSHAPVYQVSFTLEYQHDVDSAAVASGVSPLPLSVSDSLFDLSLFITPKRGAWQLLWQYNSDLFSEFTMNHMADSYLALLEAICDNPQTGIFDLNLSNAAQQNQLHQWSKGAEVALEHDSVLSVIGAHAGACQPAVIDHAGELSYAELERESNRLAHLLASRGIGAGDVVLSCCDRSAELVIAAVGTMKAGAMYLPLDPALPKERIRQVTEASGAKVALGKKSSIGQLPLDLVSVVPLDVEFREKLFAAHSNDALDVEILPEQGAYMIFTSGTTGTPKGVMISHKALVNLSQWHTRTYQILPGVRTSLLAGNGFDASVWEMFPALYGGASLVCVDDATRNDPGLLAKHLTAHNVKQAFIPTSLLHVLDELEMIDQTGLEVILTGGDKLNRLKHASQSGCKIYNHYGPTEATVLVCSAEVLANQHLVPPIGAVIDNTQLYVLNGQGKLQPPGAFGELCVSGTAVMNGYLGAARSACITVDAFGESFEVYNTGDYVRYLSNGELAYGYRKDSQVKLNGFRVEVGEVVEQLLAHENITDAWVSLQLEGEQPHLVAHLVGKCELDMGAVKARLRAKLPGYMVPVAYMQIEHLPVNVNGKVERNQLPKVPLDRVDNYIAPEDDIESQLQSIWQEQLGTLPISVNSNFFDIGGTSLTAIAVVNRINRELGVELSVAEAIRRNTIRSQAEFVRQMQRLAASHDVVAEDDALEVMEW